MEFLSPSHLKSLSSEPSASQQPRGCQGGDCKADGWILEGETSRDQGRTARSQTGAGPCQGQSQKQHRAFQPVESLRAEDAGTTEDLRHS